MLYLCSTMSETLFTHPQQLARALVDWFEQNARALPWRTTRDPYHIWLSEIILQQTRVVQGYDYFVRFVEAFPSVTHLAQASEDQVLSLWQGLGYYSRAHNLHRAAQVIVSEYQGVFPTDFRSIRALPGVGDYTAGAIASFAFDLPYPAVDGNVLRVVSRLLASELPIDTLSGKRLCTQAVEQLLATHLPPSKLGQTLIELGALVCTPKSPQCSTCPASPWCQVADLPLASLLPIKGKKLSIRDRYFSYIYTTCGNMVLLEKRGRNDIWRGLYQFPLLESSTPTSLQEVALWLQKVLQTSGALYPRPAKFTLNHRLSHQLLHITLYTIQLEHNTLEGEQYQWIPLEALGDYAIPTPLVRFLEQLH